MIYRREISLLVLFACVVGFASGQTTAGQTTAAMTSTFAASGATVPSSCTAVSPSNVRTDQATLFTITGTYASYCDAVMLNWVPPPPTTSAAPTTTTLATTTSPATTLAATTGPTTPTTAAPTTLAATTAATTPTTAAPTTLATTTAATTLPPTTSVWPSQTVETFQTSSGGATLASSRQFVFHPPMDGLYQVILHCYGQYYTANPCGTFFSTTPSPPITLFFSGTAPASGTTAYTNFVSGFSAGVAAAAGVPVSNIVNVNLVNTRRRTGFAASFQVIGTQSVTPAAVVSAVAAAASSGALAANIATQLTAAGVTTPYTVVGIATTPGGTTAGVAAAPTTKASGTPAPSTNAAPVTAAAFFHMIALLAALCVASLL